MALILADSCTRYDSNTQLAGTYGGFGAKKPNVSKTGGRRNKGYIGIVVGSESPFYSVTPFSIGLSGVSELFISLAAAMVVQPATHMTLFTLRGADTLISCILFPNGSLNFYRGGGAGSTFLASAGTALSTSYKHLAFRFVIADTGGVIQVRVNGSTTNLVDFTGNTKNSTDSLITSVAFGHIPGTDSSYNSIYGSAAELRLTDIIINTTSGSDFVTWPGDLHAEYLLPIASGTLNDAIGSDGNSTDNHLLVDEATINTADFIQLSSVGQKQTFTYPALDYIPTTIPLVQPVYYSKKDDAGSKSIGGYVKQGGSEAAGSVSTALSTSDMFVAAPMTTNPVTSAAWTNSDLGAEIGVTVTV